MRLGGDYGDDHWKWHVSGGPVLGANETREFIIRSLGATRKGGGRNGNDTRVENNGIGVLSRERERERVTKGFW